MFWVILSYDILKLQQVECVSLWRKLQMNFEMKHFLIALIRDVLYLMKQHKNITSWNGLVFNMVNINSINGTLKGIV